MKRLYSIPLILVSAFFLFEFSGCYTQFVIRERPQTYTEEYPEYSETYQDSTGTVVNNNYYSDYPRSRMYFSYYYPSRVGFMWSSYYDPFFSDPYWDWPYYSWYSPYVHNNWFYSPYSWYGGYGGYGGYGYNPWYYGGSHWNGGSGHWANTSTSRVRSTA